MRPQRFIIRTAQKNQTTVLEDILEDRIAADLHHGLRRERGFLTDLGAEATG